MTVRRWGKAPQTPAKALNAAEAMQRAAAFFRAGDLASAERLCRAVLSAKPDDFDALHLSAMVAAGGGRLEEADRLLSRALGAHRGSADAHANLGNIRSARGLLAQALASYDRALEMKPEFPEALNARGIVLQRLRRYGEALASHELALKLRPDFVAALSNRGTALKDLGRFDEAFESYDRALALKPDFVEALNNRGGALKDVGRLDEALQSYDRALALKPDLAVAHYNRGAVLSALKRHDEALPSYDRALALKRDFPEALNNRGAALAVLGHHRDAVGSYDRALLLQPGFAEALNNRGAALSHLGRNEAASSDLEHALALNPELPFARGTLLHARMHCCDWRAYEEDSTRVIADVRAGKPAIEPFMFLGVSDSAEDQHRCSRSWVRDHCVPSASRLWNGNRYRHDRIRLAYVSAHFHERPLGYLMARLFELHDRSRFETIAISSGPDDRSVMRARLKAAFDRFIDVRQRSDREVVQLMRGLEIDIAVDRTSFTQGARPGIFAMRAAPIQVSYLAYPGTMGADFIDYVVADEVVIPPEHHAWYAEKVVYLPDSYFVNDSTRKIADRTPSRADLGLPERGFVFCCFNNNYKTTPQMFDVWMRLLRQVDGSVLWLLEGNAAAQNNLRREAAARHVHPDRLIFAPRVAHEDHLARHRQANLFLDTLPYNAHTTAIDALWAGLPVLTCIGTTFAGRVAASLLQAIGLPELITDSLDEYAALALRLAGDPARLGEIEQKLLAHRTSWPLFDTDRFRRHIEAAYIEMWERHQRGEPPASFSVASVP
ncbi:MAG TPA: tetratricopeptide repeat protein [Casimicrobiaceae bacterium]|nr:tetratricopeptide repeat protein [Casimicrobiaceae bacterium]